MRFLQIRIRLMLLPASWLLAAAEPAEAVKLTRGPYLQLLSTTSVTVVWNTDVSASCSLAIRPLNGVSSVTTGSTGTVCAIPVAGLAPGTSYSYVPRANGATLTNESTFRTDDPTRPFSFLVLGDSGTGGTKQMAIRDRMLATPADLIVHTGDMIYDDGEAADFNPKFFQPYHELLRRLVLWPCLGNHDVHTQSGAPWRAAFYTPANNPARSENYYSFDYGNAHFVVLDSNASLAKGSAQYTFLDADLGASTALWKFVFFHHPIYSSGEHGSATSIRASLVPLFDEHAVDIVFMGHDHDYERTLPMLADRVVAPGAGTIYVTTGGGGASIRPVGRSSFTAYSESLFHYTRVAIDDGELTAQIIREDGAIRDRLTLVKGSSTTPRCGDGLVNQPSEQCDGDDHPACLGSCDASCVCASACGDGLRQGGEACDGHDDAACPGLCLSSCGCGAPSQFVTLTPSADTYIEAGAQASWDHGVAPHLDVDRSPFDIAYLRFDLSGVTASVTRATLIAYCLNSSPDGGTIYPVGSSSWVEGNRNGLDSASAQGPGLKWTDVDTNGDGSVDGSDQSPYVPDFTQGGGALSCLNGQDSEADVTAMFQEGPGVYTVALKNDATDGGTYASRENSNTSQRPRLRLELGTGGGTTTTTTTTVPSTSTPVAVVLADATVRSDQPNTNFGANAVLDADASPDERTFFRIGVSGVGGRSLRSIRLRLRVPDVSGAPSDSGGFVRAVSGCSWDEGTITWATQPAMTSGRVDTAGAVQVNDLVEFELRPAIAGDGTWCVALDTDSDNGVIYNSREAAAGRPALVIELGTPTTTTTTSTTTTTFPTLSAVIEADVTTYERQKQTNFGAASVLEVARQPSKTITYLRGRVTGVAGRRVASARLRMVVASQSNAGGDKGGKFKWFADCSWNEMTATWEQDPDRGGSKELVQVARVAPGQVVEIDATEFVTRDGAYCFMIEAESDDTVFYNSREAASGKPSLVLQLAP